jgi:hypothetical protein
MIFGMTRRAGLIAIAAAVSMLAGCSLFHHQPTPTEQFTSALARGNSMEAATIWRTMTPEEKEEFAVGGGMKPDAEMEAAAKKEAEQQLEKQNAVSGAAADNSSAEDDDNGQSGKTLADFFHGPSGKGSITDNDGRSGHTLQDFIPYMKGHTDDQNQTPDAAAPAPPSDSVQPAWPTDDMQVK